MKKKLKLGLVLLGLKAYANMSQRTNSTSSNASSTSSLKICLAKPYLIKPSHKMKWNKVHIGEPKPNKWGGSYSKVYFTDKKEVNRPKCPDKSVLNKTFGVFQDHGHGELSILKRL